MDITSPRWLAWIPGMVIVFGGGGCVCIGEGGRSGSSGATSTCAALSREDVETCESDLSTGSAAGETERAVGASSTLAGGEDAIAGLGDAPTTAVSFPFPSSGTTMGSDAC